MKFIFFLLSLSMTHGFINNRILFYNNPISSTFNMKFDEYSEKEFVTRYTNYLDEKSLTEFYKYIDKQSIDNIYFSNDMKKIIAKIHEETHDNSNIFPEDYFLVESNYELSNSLVKTLTKNNVQTYILKPSQPDSSISFLNGFTFAGQFISNFIFPVLLLSYIVQIVLANRSNPFSNRFIANSNTKEKSDIIIEELQNSNVTLDSWSGSPEIFEECTEIVSYLKNNTNYINAGAEIPKGILLEGPPGTGKTLLAKAIASEASCNFISISASEFVEIFVGMGASKVRNLFEEARKSTPCIIFIDEIDAVGRQRGAGINMGNDEREQTLNQLLSEMDGFTNNDNIIVMAATNRRDVLDAALLRPGRFDRIINVPLPDKTSRKKILNSYLEKKQFDDKLNIDLLSEMTSGFSGAEIKNLVNEAAINAARVGNTTLTEINLNDAIEKIVVGIIKKDDTRNEETIKRIAIHEIGHAFLVKYFNEYFDLNKVTIQSTYNGAGGYTLFNEKPDISESGLYTNDLLFKRLVISMGGKAAEFVYYGDDFVSLGAVQDLKQANSLARKMIGNFGMGNELKVFFSDQIESDGTPFLGKSLATGDKYSERTKTILDKEIIELLVKSYNSAVNIIINNKDMFHDMVNSLIKEKILYDNDSLMYNSTKIKKFDFSNRF